jgi:Rrf2 family protein
VERAGGAKVRVREIAEAEGIPRHFLVKILHQLSGHDLVEASRGPGGGFVLARPADEIRLRHILEAVDGSEARRDRCVLGSQPCDPENPCPLHEVWSACRDRFWDDTVNRTLADLARQPYEAISASAVAPMPSGEPAAWRTL